MDKALLLGFTLGFITASPVGPMGMLCLRRTLTRGMVTGLISALGIACAYAFWTYVVIHGLAAVSHWIEEEKVILQSAIGVFFILYGLHGIFRHKVSGHHVSENKGGLAEFFSTFVVVFLNPATVIMFSALFALCGMAKSHFGSFESLEVACSVFGGSVAFWIVVTQAVKKARAYLDDSIYNLITRISSHAIMLFGIAILSCCIYENLRTVFIQSG